MVSTEPESDNNKFCANVMLELSSPGTLSIPCTGTSPAPPSTAPMSPDGTHDSDEPNRNSSPALIAWAPLVQPNVSVQVDSGLLLPYSEQLTTVPAMQLNMCVENN